MFNCKSEKIGIMRVLNRRYCLLAALFIFLFFLGAGMSSGAIDKKLQKTSDSIFLTFQNALDHHCAVLNIYPDAQHYFLLPEGTYLKRSVETFSPHIFLNIVANAFFNGLFQPLFLCVFTPETILHYVLFPFFIYGAVRYFRKIPLLILFFFLYLLYAGVYNAIVESLIRHRMPCDLIYLSIGLAGFSDAITRRSS